MNTLPSGVPVKWEYSNGYFTKKRVLPPYISNGEVEYVMFTGHKIGHHLCDSYMDGEGQLRIGKKNYQFALVIRSKREIHSFHGCYWYVAFSSMHYSNTNLLHLGMVMTVTKQDTEGKGTILVKRMLKQIS